MEFVHVCIDDASRIAFTMIRPDEKARSAIAFLKPSMGLLGWVDLQRYFRASAVDPHLDNAFDVSLDPPPQPRLDTDGARRSARSIGSNRGGDRLVIGEFE